MKHSIVYIFTCFIFLVFAGCNSTSYEIEELIDPVDTVKTAVNTEIKKDLEPQAVEIKEEVGGKESGRKIDSKLYTIQIGAFENEKNAREFTEKAKTRLPYGFHYEFSGGLYKVRSSNIPPETSPEPVFQKIRDAGYIDSFMVEVSK